MANDRCDGYFVDVIFREKLLQLIADRGLNKSRLADAAGLEGSTVGSYFSSRGSLPRIDVAMKIARALNVSLDWLADDSQDFPPPTLPANSVSRASDHDLMKEVCHRFRLEAIRLRDVLSRCERVDFSTAAVVVRRTPAGSRLPAEVAPAVELDHALSSALFGLYVHDPDRAASGFFDELPGGIDASGELRRERLAAQAKAFMEAPGYREFDAAMAERLDQKMRAGEALNEPANRRRKAEV